MEYELECYSDADIHKDACNVVETRTRYEVSLSDLARPAKRKGTSIPNVNVLPVFTRATGVQKEFEMVAMPQRVIELEDEAELEDEEWEEVEYELEDNAKSRPTYAAILSHMPG